MIEAYTYEPGVRKLKEILFEIISEINIEILQMQDIDMPLVITKDIIKNKYFD